MNVKRITAGLFAAVLSAYCNIPAMTAKAADEPVFFYEEHGYYAGDVNNSGDLDVSDVVLLQNWLLGRAVPEGTIIERADMIHNGVINVYDLISLKSVLFGELEPEWIEQELPPDEELMTAPVSYLAPTLMSTGHNRLLMFVVDFPDCKFSADYSVEQIRNISFGAGDTSSLDYPYESVSGYYERASYGALSMDADIYIYSAQEPVENYIRYDDNGKRWANQDKLLDEIMSAMDNELNFADYDLNKDGVMDTILISVADSAPSDGWWPCSGEYYGGKEFDGIIAGNVIIGNTSPSNVLKYNSTWIHELGHAMGIPDYYRYTNSDYDFEGLKGTAGTEMMDDARGDMCAFSKLMYGWYTPSQVSVYTGGTQTYTLESSQVKGGCIVIPRNELNGFLSEYMVIEYATGNGNNTGLFQDGGIRVLHCNSKFSLDYWGRPFLIWNNYSEYYDQSNEKQRVLRLANQAEGGDFFTSGSIVDGNISGFHWYDDYGSQTVEVGCKITVGELDRDTGKYTITISE